MSNIEGRITNAEVIEKETTNPHELTQQLLTTDFFDKLRTGGADFYG